MWAQRADGASVEDFGYRVERDWSYQLTTCVVRTSVRRMTILRPVERRSVPDEVTDQLADVIVAGEVPPGGQLPSERDLAERLGVSRPTVRAALARLAASGLVETRQGGGSTVRDFRRHGGLDLLPRLLVGQGGVDLGVVRDVVEARTMFGPQVAALAARASAGADADARLRAAAEAVATGEDDAARQHAASAFWDELVDRGDSIVFRLLYNQLRAAYEPALDALAGVLAVETDRPELFAGLAAAVVAGDRDAATERATELLRLGEVALLSAIEDVRQATRQETGT